MSNDISLVSDFIVASNAPILPPAMISPNTQGESLQEYLRRECAKQGIDHEDIAARAKDAGHKISATYVNNMMNGSAVNPSTSKILALAAGLHKKDPTDVFRAAYGQPQVEGEDIGGLFYALSRDFRLLSDSEQETYGHHLELIHQAIVRSIKAGRKK